MEAIARPFTSTCVFYEEGDILGFIAAFASLVPIFVMVSLATILVSRRDLHTCTLILGKILDDAVNAVLKHVIAQPRPAHGLDNWSSAYGMPSNHSQFMSFLCTYGFLWAFFGKHWKIEQKIWQSLSLVCLVCGSMVVMMSRVHLRYHTWEQVVVGAVVGIVTGFMWYFITEQYLRPSFRKLVAVNDDERGSDNITNERGSDNITTSNSNSGGKRDARNNNNHTGIAKTSVVWQWCQSIAQFLMLRDCSDVNVLLIEYQAILEAAKHNHQQKMMMTRRRKNEHEHEEEEDLKQATTTTSRRNKPARYIQGLTQHDEEQASSNVEDTSSWTGKEENGSSSHSRRAGKQRG